MHFSKLITLGLLCIMPTSVFGIVGFGIHGLRDFAKLGAYEYTDGEGLLAVNLKSYEMAESPAGIGGYVFFDFAGWAIEAEGSIAGGLYNFSFGNQFATIDSIDFVWGRASTGVTVKKDLMSFKIPILAKAALSAGLGMTNHVSTPRANVDMVKQLMGDDLINTSFEPTNLEDQLITYLDENKLEGSAFHAQVGLRFKVLMFDTHFIFRYNVGKDIYAGKSGFAETQLKVGFAF